MPRFVLATPTPASMTPASRSATEGGMAEQNRPGAVPPPPGVTADFEHPGDAGRDLVIGWLVACNALSLFFFVVRAYSQVWMRHKILAEDITCAISWALIHLYSATAGMMIHYGEGLHIWEVSAHDYSQFLKWLYASSIIYIPAAYFTKVTLLLVIARVFTVRERIASSIRIFILVLLVAYLPIQILKTIICLPIRAFWEATVEGRCLDQARIFISDIALAILTDLIVLVIPIVLIWPMQASLKKKLKVVVMLGAGGVAVAVTSYRMYVVVMYFESTDVTADFVVQSITVMVELTIGLVSSCFPAVNMAVSRYRAARSSATRISSRSSWTWPPIKRFCDVITRKTPGTESHGTPATLGPVGNRPAAERAEPASWSAHSGEWDLEGQLTPRLSSLTAERGVLEGWLSRDSEYRDLTSAATASYGGVLGGLPRVGGSGLGDYIWDGDESQLELATVLRSRPPDG